MCTAIKDIEEYIKRAVGLYTTEDGIIKDQDFIGEVIYKGRSLSVHENNDTKILYQPMSDIEQMSDLLRYQITKLSRLGELERSFFIETYEGSNIKIILRSLDGSTIDTKFHENKFLAYAEMIFILGNIDDETVDILLK